MSDFTKQLYKVNVSSLVAQDSHHNNLGVRIVEDSAAAVGSILAASPAFLQSVVDGLPVVFDAPTETGCQVKSGTDIRKLTSRSRNFAASLSSLVPTTESLIFPKKPLFSPGRPRSMSSFLDELVLAADELWPGGGPAGARYGEVSFSRVFSRASGCSFRYCSSSSG